MVEYKWPILLGGMSLLLVAGAIVFLVRSIQTTKPIEFSDVCEHADSTSHNLDSYRRADSTSYNLCSLLRSGSTSQNEQASGSALISVNSASQIELELLPGVGPATAKKIMDNRPYESVSDLMMKKVMGEKLFEKVKNFIAL